MRSDSERLMDIIDSIEVIEKAIASNAMELHQLQDIEYLGIVRCIEIIGEAVNNISKQVKEQYQKVPWKEIVKMRNVVVHQYFEIDHDMVDIVVRKSIPELKKQIEQIIKEVG